MTKHLPEHALNLLHEQGGAATTRELSGVGLTKNDLARLVRCQMLVRTGRGRYALASTPNAPTVSGESPWVAMRLRHLRHVAAALRAAPGAVASLRSAALAWGLPVSAIPKTPELTRPPRRSRLANCRTVESNLDSRDIATANGLPVTSLERTVVDVALDMPTPDAFITVDAALARGASRETMLQILAARGAVRGCRRARQTLDWADGHCESALESLSRGKLLTAGIPRPQCNVWVRFEVRCYRVDELWEELGIVGEADGRIKYQGELAVGDTLWKEKVRQEWLECSVGLLVVRWTTKEIRHSPVVVALRWRGPSIVDNHIRGNHLRA